MASSGVRRLQQAKKASSDDEEKKEKPKKTVWTTTADKADAYLSGIGRGGEVETRRKRKNKY